MRGRRTRRDELLDLDPFLRWIRLRWVVPGKADEHAPLEGLCVWSGFEPVGGTKALWLNDLYYGAGAVHLPASCREMIGAYRTVGEVPGHLVRVRDRVKQIW